MSVSARLSFSLDLLSLAPGLGPREVGGAGAERSGRPSLPRWGKRGSPRRGGPGTAEPPAGGELRSGRAPLREGVGEKQRSWAGLPGASAGAACPAPGCIRARLGPSPRTSLTPSAWFQTVVGILWVVSARLSRALLGSSKPFTNH